MAEVSGAVQQVCEQYQSRGLLEMGTAVVSAYLNAKMRSVKASSSLYAVSSDIDGAAIAKTAAKRARHMLAGLFASAREGLCKDPEIVASMVIAALKRHLAPPARIKLPRAPSRTAAR